VCVGLGLGYALRSKKGIEGRLPKVKERTMESTGA